MRAHAPPRFVLIREVVQANDVEPGAFLRWGAGRPRGFWARRWGWLAHVGSLESLTIESTSGSDDRFGEIRDRASRLTPVDGGSAWPGEHLSADGESPGPPRYYGGFSFRDDHVARDFWVTFPSARFLLPELELEQIGDGRRLTAQALVTNLDDPDGVRSRLRELLGRAQQQLAVAGEASPRAVPHPAAKLESERGGWSRAVTDTLGAIREGELAKAVLARILDVSTTGTLDPVDVLEYLRKENTEAHVFLFEPEPGAPILGAAPETIATVRGEVCHATAVAGSVPRGRSAAEQRDFAQQLLSSEKDRVEHAYTVEDMVERLTRFASDVEAETDPHVLTLARIQHLETRIRAMLHPGTSVLDVVAALHPTPAVCGFPRDAALDLLLREEPFERGWYAGPVGWFDTAGNGVFVPALRTAVARETTWRLFAGAGIVPGSHPDLEWEETGIKFEPVLRALAAAGAR